MYYRKIILAALCLMPAHTILAQSQPQKVIADKIVAIVGDRIILYSDIKKSIDLAQQDETSPYDAECIVAEQAIVSKILAQQAEKDSLEVTDEEVEAELDQKIRYYIRQLGSAKILEEVAGKSVSQLKDESRAFVKEKRLEESMLQKIVTGIKITPAEVRTFFDAIPKDSLPLFESEFEIGQVILYPAASKDLEQYIVNELNHYKKQVEGKTISLCQLVKTKDSKDGCIEAEITRNEKIFDHAFLSAAFRLKNGEISAPIKTKSGFYLIEMAERKGDNAIVRYIFRVPPVTDAEINQAKAKLDTVRSKIIAGTIGFNEAASKYNENVSGNFSSFILNQDGAPYVPINQLSKELTFIISGMKVGDISQPVSFANEQNKKDVRIIYLKSRSEPHRMNLHDDYSKISQMALEEKKGLALNKWLKAKISTYYIMVDSETAADCPKVQKYASTDTKGF